MSKDFAELKTFFTIRRFNDRESYQEGVPDSISRFEKNLFLTEGITKLWNLLVNNDTTGYFSEANTYIGVGNDTTSETEGQTALQGGSTFYAPMDSGYPTVSGDTVTFYATFGGTEANFAWEEFTIANGGSDTAVNLNRKVSNQGTKASGAVWEFQVDLTIT